MNATIINNTRWGDKYGMLTLDAPAFAAAYRPGQLCMLSVQPAGVTDPLLRRPFAPYTVDDGVKILYAVVGKGTEILSHQHSGTVLSLSSPHGKPFKLVKNQKTALIAGGVGVAPMHCLAQALAKNGCDVHIYYGGRSKSDLYEPLLFMPTQHNWFYSTEDGSHGHKGYSVAPFEGSIDGFDTVYACGPLPMMRAVRNICQAHGKPLQVSLEAVMACGVGVCAGCLVKTVSGYVRCCTEGPVFDGHSVVWE